MRMSMNVPETQTTVSKVVPILLEALSAHASLDMNLMMIKGLVLVSTCSCTCQFKSIDL